MLQEKDIAAILSWNYKLHLRIDEELRKIESTGVSAGTVR